MHRTALLVPVLAIATGGALLPAATAHSAQAPKPISRDAADSRNEQRTVAKYWTAARMAAAPPLDLPAQGAGNARPGSTTATAGTPLTVAATAPAARESVRQAAARETSGAVWPRAGAIARTTGRVFFTTANGRNASCSGSAVTSANKSVVITAGHCVKLGDSFHRNWVFVPGYANGRRPYGTWVATTLVTTPQWNTDEQADHDVAAAVVAPLDGRRLIDVVGGQGIAFNQARRRPMHSFGYPASGPYDGSRLIFCSGQAFDDTRMSRAIGLTCDMTGGASGGPWFLAFNESTGVGTQNSVNSFKYNVAPHLMFGPYFGQAAKAVYDAAQRNGAT
ncbi:trypsin-like peptidase domain-containing protein [Streptosporangium sp. KLBMP 9127]|nr:peptidase [Streptosporangium sp. KLBMP 9127]